MPSDSGTTPLEVSRYIGTVLRRQRGLIDAVKDAELRARELRREADKAEARAYLRTDGPAHAKKYHAGLDPDFDRMSREADVAEVTVKHLRDLIRLCGDEMDGARTAAATLRKEFEVMGLHSADGA
jgi:hypothetical protein